MQENCQESISANIQIFRKQSVLLKSSYITQIIFRINSVSVCIYLFLKKSVVLLFLCGSLLKLFLQQNSFKFQYSRERLHVLFCKCSAVVLTPQRIHHLSFQNWLGKYTKLKQRISHSNNTGNLVLKATEKNIHSCLNNVLIMNKNPFSAIEMHNYFQVQEFRVVLPFYNQLFEFVKLVFSNI